MKTLLAIINEPEKAKGFIGYVAHLAQDLLANVHLMYVQEPYDYSLGQPPASAAINSVMAIQKSNAENANKKFAMHIKEVHDTISGDISISYSVEIASLISIVEEYCTENKADMVILEDHEKSGFWFQNTSENDIINHVNCPVWVIPPGADYKPLKEIIYATDYKKEDIPTLKNLIGLTSRFSPAITALHITDSVDFEEKVKKAGFREMLQTETEYKNITVKSLVEKSNENSAQLINEYALNTNADVIVVLKENRNFIERILNPSSTKKILKEARLPVLVYQY